MPDSTIAAIDSLTKRGFGTAEFLIDEHGNPILIESIFTVKLKAGESFADFFARAKLEGIWQHDDRMQMPVNNGKTDYVRIIRPAK